MYCSLGVITYSLCCKALPPTLCRHGSNFDMPTSCKWTPVLRRWYHWYHAHLLAYHGQLYEAVRHRLFITNIGFRGLGFADRNLLELLDWTITFSQQFASYLVYRTKFRLSNPFHPRFFESYKIFIIFCLRLMDK